MSSKRAARKISAALALCALLLCAAQVGANPPECSFLVELTNEGSLPPFGPPDSFGDPIMSSNGQILVPAIVSFSPEFIQALVWRDQPGAAATAIVWTGLEVPGRPGFTVSSIPAFGFTGDLDHPVAVQVSITDGTNFGACACLVNGSLVCGPCTGDLRPDGSTLATIEGLMTVPTHGAVHLIVTDDGGDFGIDVIHPSSQTLFTTPFTLGDVDVESLQSLSAAAAGPHGVIAYRGPDTNGVTRDGYLHFDAAGNISEIVVEGGALGVFAEPVSTLFTTSRIGINPTGVVAGGGRLLSASATNEIVFAIDASGNVTAVREGDTYPGTGVTVEANLGGPVLGPGAAYFLCFAQGVRNICRLNLSASTVGFVAAAGSAIPDGRSIGSLSKTFLPFDARLLFSAPLDDGSTAALLGSPTGELEVCLSKGDTVFDPDSGTDRAVANVSAITARNRGDSPQGQANGADIVLLATLDGGAQAVVTNQSGGATLEPEIVVDPLSVDLGSVVVGSAHSETVNVANLGDAPLTISSVTVTGGSFQVDGDVPTELLVGESFDITITFQPATLGAATGNLSIESDDPDQPAVDVPLSGSGVCAEGLDRCETECVDLQDDPDNCGACDNTCAVDDVCFRGQCESALADVEVEKVGPPLAFVGGAIWYQIRVTNHGPDDATVAVSDAIPAGTILADSQVRTSGSSSCIESQSPQTLVCTLASLSAGGTAYIDIVVDVEDGAQGPIENGVSAEVSGAADLNPDNNQGAATADLVAEEEAPHGQIEVVKTGPELDQAQRGATITFQIVVTNLGPDDVPFLRLYDVAFDLDEIQAIRSPVPCVPTYAAALEAFTLTCTFDSGLASGASATVEVDVLPAQAADTVTNIAFVQPASDGIVDVVPEDDTSEVVVSVFDQATDVAIRKEAPPAAVRGGLFLYRLVIENDGETVTDVEVQDLLPEGVSVFGIDVLSSVAHECSGPDEDGRVSCRFFEMAGDDYAEILITVETDADTPTGPIENIAGARPSDAADTDPSDNIATTTTDLTDAGPVANISVDKRGPAEVAAGEPFSYEIAVTNEGPEDVPFLRLYDVLATQATSVVISSTSGHEASCDVTDEVATCTFADGLAAGETVFVDVTVEGPTLDDFTNTAFVTPGLDGIDDPDTEDNSDSVHTVIDGLPALVEVTKEAALIDLDLNGFPSAGDEIFYLVTIVNEGRALDELVYTDAPDPDTLLVAGSVTIEPAGQGRVERGNGQGDVDVVVELDYLPEGGAVAIGYRVELFATFENPTVDNQGTLTSDDLLDFEQRSDDPTTEEADDVTKVGVGPPQLAVTKTFHADSLAAREPRFVLATERFQARVAIEVFGEVTFNAVSFRDVPNPDASGLPGLGGSPGFDPEVGSLVAGSVATTLLRADVIIEDAGEVVHGNEPEADSVEVAIGSLQPGDIFLIEFEFEVEAEANATVSFLNQGLVESPIFEQPTDDPATPATDDPTSLERLGSLSVSLDPADPFIVVGDELDLDVKVLSDGEAFTDRGSFPFTSDSPSVATVDDEGVVVGLAPGSALISVDAFDQLAVTEIEVGCSQDDDCPLGQFCTISHSCLEGSPDQLFAQKLPIEHIDRVRDVRLGLGDRIRYRIVLQGFNADRFGSEMELVDCSSAELRLVPGTVEVHEPEEPEFTIERGNDRGDDCVGVRFQSGVDFAIIDFVMEVVAEPEDGRICNQGSVYLDENPQPESTYDPRIDPGGDLAPSPTCVPFDVALCHFEVVTIEGTPDPDRLVGTPGRDVIHGLNGDDEIDGLGGDDVICGGNGSDVLRGGAGADVLLGEGGDDLLCGDDGDCVLLHCGDGDEETSGGDKLAGGLGNDTLCGHGAGDELYGGRGDDFLHGGSSSDALCGEEGRDVFDGGADGGSCDAADGEPASRCSTSNGLPQCDLLSSDFEIY